MAEAISAISPLKCIALAVSTRPVAAREQLRENSAGGSGVEAFLLRLGFKGLLWGPVEETGWGPAVREALTASAPPLGSCGRVALYALAGASVATRAK
jgi:hypothetical protein